MSNRTLVELNHDFRPAGDNQSLLAWAKKMRSYMGSGTPQDLPSGVTFKWRRHHSDPCPFDQPLEFERRHPRSRKP